jgi:hypothetical protein
MYDVAYLRKLAARYRKLARNLKHATISGRLEAVAEDLERKIREIQTVAGLPVPQRLH